MQLPRGAAWAVHQGPTGTPPQPSHVCPGTAFFMVPMSALPRAGQVCPGTAGQHAACGAHQQTGPPRCVCRCGHLRSLAGHSPGRRMPPCPAHLAGPWRYEPAPWTACLPGSAMAAGTACAGPAWSQQPELGSSAGLVSRVCWTALGQGWGCKVGCQMQTCSSCTGAWKAAAVGFEQVIGGAADSAVGRR